MSRLRIVPLLCLPILVASLAACGTAATPTAQPPTTGEPSSAAALTEQAREMQGNLLYGIHRGRVEDVKKEGKGSVCGVGAFLTMYGVCQMNLIGSLIRRLGINIGNSSGSVHQNVRDSSDVVQAGRDVNVYQGEPQKSYPKIGEAYFPECGVTLSVHDFRAGVDRGDSRYRASLATAQVAKFTAALRETDYMVFGIQDNQGPVGDIPCNVTVPGGNYQGMVTYIEIGQWESTYLSLRCWFTVPVVKAGTA